MKKIFAVLMCLVLVVSIGLTACGSKQNNESQSSSETTDKGADKQNAAKEGSDTNGKDKFEIVLIAKTEGLAWFDDMRKGVDEFNDTHDDVNVSQIAPEGGDPAKQASMFEDIIARGVDAICVVPNDPQSLVPAIKKAKENGIIVISHEAQQIAGIVDWDMEAFSNEDFGALYGEKLAKAMGGKGKYCGTVGALTMETHNQWYNAAVKYIKENYPEMELVREQPFEDKIDAKVAYDLGKEILKAYPDLGGYLGMTVEAGASMCRLLSETNNKNLKVSCLALPSALGDYIRDGWCAHGQCWRPADAGYVTVNIAYKMLKGVKIEDGINLEKTGYENCVTKDGVVFGNAPLVLTPENVDSLDF